VKLFNSFTFLIVEPISTVSCSFTRVWLRYCLRQTSISFLSCMF